MMKKLHEIMSSGNNYFHMIMEEDEEKKTITCKAEITYDLTKKSHINEIVRIMRKDTNPLLKKLYRIQYDHKRNIKEGRRRNLFDDEYINYIEKKKAEIDSKSER